jgi:hypothetical protein
MMQKRNLILAGATVALLLLGWLLGRPDPSGDGIEGIGEPLLPAVQADVNQVSGLKLSGAGGELIVQVERAGEQWKVSSSHGYPADVTVVRRFLLALKDSVKRDVRTSKPERYASIGVDDPTASSEAKGLLVELSGVAEPNRLIIGTFAAAGGGDHTYVRLADQEQSWLASGNLIPEKTASNWLQRDVLDVPSSRISSVTISASDGKTLSLSKANESDINYSVENVPKGRELSSASAGNALAGVLGSLQHEGVLPAAEAEPPAEGVYSGRYLTRDGLVVTMQGWEQGEQRLVRISAVADPAAIEAWATQEQVRREAAAAASAAAAAASESSVDPAEADAGESNEQAGATDAEAAETAADSSAPADPAAAVAAIVAEQTAKIEAEAQAINDRSAGWTFVLPTWKYSNLAKTMDDLLKAPE